MTVFVPDYGRHTSLILPHPQGGYCEFAYGDWGFFAMNRKHWYNGIGALFFSQGATLGRRHLDAPPIQDNMIDSVPASHTLRLAVSRDKADHLWRQLHERYMAESKTAVFNPLSRMFFVHDSEHYSIFHNCNHLTAGWLRELGCRIEGSATTSDFRLPK